MSRDDLKTTAGELKAQLKDIPDDAPLLILYDGQAGVSMGIEVIDPATLRHGGVDWPDDPDIDRYVYLDISRGQ
jgi:hypothetical protein